MNGVGCVSSASIGVSSIGNTVAVEATASSPCEGGTIELSANTDNTGVTFAWTGPNGFYSAGQNASVENATSENDGFYTVTATETATGCSATDSVLAVILAHAFADVYDTACGSFDWYGQTYTQSDSYTHTFTGGAANGCDSTVTLHLTIYELPFVEITGDLSFCEGDAITLTATAGFDTYVWNGVAGGQDLEVSNGGMVTLTATDANGCHAYDTVDVTLNPTPAQPVADVTPNTSCTAQNGVITVTAPTGDGYSYSINGTEFQTETAFTGLAEGN